MRRAILAVFVTALLIVPTALAAKHAPKASSSVTISASATTVTIGSGTTISGVVTGKKSAGATVRLRSTPFPYAAPFATVTTTTASSTGHYSFTVKPEISRRYEVTANTAPAATSSIVQVRVRVKVGVRTSTLHPLRGHRVRFFGNVQPAFNGRMVLIQRRTATGSWRTVARATLVPNTPFGGFSRSHYSRRVRINRSGTYRVRFVPPTAAYLANNSRTRRETVH
jgi:hypothetical protein